jgi:hypothetical protein
MNDKTELIIDKAEAALANKGVRLEAVDALNDHTEFRTWWRGMANKRAALYTLPSQSEDLSDDDIDAKVNEIITHVERVIRAGGEKEAEE